ncbi:hypothetical protein Adt_06176 [Abeliophyllum distichum]|uniref:Uncharacterized protein n=1 Tax=Abeliophyllum distichum TaxID=126358 RepID=A0ABD1V670_9LAMI
MDLGNYIYTLISILGFQTDKRHTAIFPALISGICEAAGVQISPAKPEMKSKGPINRFALENARRHTARPVGAVPVAQDQPPEQQPAAPQPAAPPADNTALLRQLLEGQAEQTRLIVATRTEMREQRRIRADCDEVKRRLDRCAGQLDDIHDKICRPAPTPSQDPSPVDPTALLLPAPSDQNPGSI